MVMRILSLLLFGLMATGAVADLVDLSPEELQYLSNRGSIQLCVDPDWMPFEKINEQGQHVGIAADFMELLEGRINYPFELVVTENWAQTVTFAKQGDCDILSMLNQTEERSGFLNFTDVYLESVVVIVGRDEITYISGLAELAKKKVALVEGYVYEEYIRREFPEIIIQTYKTMDEALRAVSQREAFATLGSLYLITYNIQRLGLTNLQISGQTERTNQFRVGVRKDDPLLTSIMQKSVASIRQEDKNRVLEKWVTVNIARDQDRLTRSLLIHGFSVIFILAFFIWYRQYLIAKFKS